jgi:hypothetical protein
MSKLRLTDWASIAEVVGAFGVVVSLIYVGLQVRDNTEEVRATNRQQLIGRAHAATNGAATNSELAAAMAKSTNGETLTPTESVQYGYFIRGLMYDVQEAFLLRQEERLDEEYWSTRASLFEAIMTGETARSVYDTDKELGILHVDFVSWAEQKMGVERNR